MTYPMEFLSSCGPKGLMQTVAASFILHVLVITAGLLFLNSDPEKVFFSPVYTVNLVARGPSAKGPVRAGAPKGPPPAATKTPVRAKTVKAPAGVKSVKTSAKKTSVKKKNVTTVSTAKATSQVSIDDALKRVAEKVRREQESSMVASRIEQLRRKTEANSIEVQKGIEDIRRAIGEAARNATGAAATAASPAGAGEGGVEGGGLDAHRSGLTASNIGVEFPEYMAALRDRVQEHWNYPEAYRIAGLQMIVSIKISRDGKLAKVWVERSSGNALFDNSLIHAIKKAAPFRPLPDSFTEELFETGLRFCPECND
jgi:TonB family protein